MFTDLVFDTIISFAREKKREKSLEAGPDWLSECLKSDGRKPSEVFKGKGFDLKLVQFAINSMTEFTFTEIFSYLTII